MKKAIIAGAASAVLAAMPVVGVFATNSTMSQTDTLNITVDAACSLATSATGAYAQTIQPGAAATSITGSTFTVTCNDAGGWYLKAAGASETTTTTNLHYSNAANETDDITTGTTLSGANSAWGFRVAGTTGVVIADGFNGGNEGTEWASIPSGSGTTVASHRNATSLGESKDSVTVTYGVYAKESQKTGLYVGKVTYTLGQPAGA